MNENRRWRIEEIQQALYNFHESLVLMGRRKSNPVTRYFKPDPDGNKIGYFSCECNIVDNNGVNKKCNVSLNGSYGVANLERHIERFHPNEFSELKVIKNKDLNSPSTSISGKRPFHEISLPCSPSTSIENSSTSSTASEDREIPKKKRLSQINLNAYNFCKSYELSIRFSFDQIKKACITLMTVDGRPYSGVEDSGFQILLRPYIDAIKRSGGKIQAVNRQQVAIWIQEKAGEIKDEIRKKISNSLIHLKADVATKHYRSFLGLNIQMHSEEDRQTMFYCIGVKELFVRHTSPNIKNVILDTLKEFNIPVENIYSFTCDNASSMLLTGKLLNESISDVPIGSADAIPLHLNNSVQEDEWDEYSVELTEINNDEDNSPFTIDEFLETEQFLDDNMENLWTESDNIITIRCSEHMMQLAVKDAWNERSKLLLNPGKEPAVESDFDEIIGLEENVIEEESQINQDDGDILISSDIIQKVRVIVKKLKATNGSIMLMELTNLKPVLDNDTRWMSTYNMLERFLVLQPAINVLGNRENNSSYKLSTYEWAEIQKMKDCLYYCKIATVKLQYENASLKDLFSIWSSTIIETKKIDHPFAKSLTKFLSERRNKLFCNITFLSCLYLEPCYKALINEDNKKLVHRHLIATGWRLERLKKNGNTDAREDKDASNIEQDLLEDDVLDSTNVTNEVSHCHVTADFVKQIQALNNHTRNKRNEPKQAEPNNVEDFEEEVYSEIIKKELKNYDSLRSITNSKDIEDAISNEKNHFWIKNRQTFPKLSEIAFTLNAAPATQCSVERLFSALDFIFNKRRTSLNSKSVNDILLIRCNTTFK